MRPILDLRITFLVLTSALWTASAQTEAHVQVHVSDAYGTSVPTTSLLFTQDGKEHPVRQDEIFAARYGPYSVEVEVQGFSVASQSGTIDQPEQVIPVAMRLGPLESPAPRCSVTGRAPDGAARVKLLELFGAYNSEVAVVGGRFEFRGLECGDYLLVALGAKECLGVRTYRTVRAADPADIPPTNGTDGRCASAIRSVR